VCNGHVSLASTLAKSLRTSSGDGLPPSSFLARSEVFDGFARALPFAAFEGTLDAEDEDDDDDDDDEEEDDDDEEEDDDDDELDASSFVELCGFEAARRLEAVNEFPRGAPPDVVADCVSRLLGFWLAFWARLDACVDFAFGVPFAALEGSSGEEEDEDDELELLSFA
jgi:hypothetical protein